MESTVQLDQDNHWTFLEPTWRSKIFSGFQWSSRVVPMFVIFARLIGIGKMIVELCSEK